MNRRKLIRAFGWLLPASWLAPNVHAQMLEDGKAAQLANGTRFYPGDPIPVEGGGVDTRARVLIRPSSRWRGEDFWTDISDLVLWVDPSLGELGVIVKVGGATIGIADGIDDPGRVFEATARCEFRLVRRDAENPRRSRRNPRTVLSGRGAGAGELTMTTNRETRAFPTEIRMKYADGKRTLVSVAPPWDTLSVPMEMWSERGITTFREKFTRGAFGSLDDADIVSTFQHDSNLLLGRTPGTLRLDDTKKGLEYEVDLAETTIGRDVAEHVARGDVRGSSFEFRVKNAPNGDRGDTWDEQEDGTWIRTIHRAELFQVGPVTHPAYENGTDVALRSLQEHAKASAPVAPPTPLVETVTSEPEPASEPVAEPAGTPRLDRARRELALAEVEL